MASVEPQSTGASPAPPDPAHKPLIDQVLRKVGRNLVIYQQIEGMLKALATTGRYSGTAEQITEQRKTKVRAIAKKPAGTVAPIALAAIFIDSDAPERTAPEDSKEVWFSFSFGLEGGVEEARKWRREIDRVMVLRNRMVHHLLNTWSITSEASCLETDRQLDEERATAMKLHGRLKSILDAFKDAVIEHAAEFAPGGPVERAIQLIALQQSPIVQLLGEATFMHARPDGWTDLASAGQVLRRQAPEDMASIKKRYGYSTLKALVAGTELFEFTTEPTTAGVRTLYRIADASDGK